MISPFPEEKILIKTPLDKEIGEKLLKEGKVASLFVAGGQGTRLGFSGPKGCYPITPFRKASLFQLFAEKTKAASLFAEKKLPLLIMTSSINDEETKTFFKKNNNFGLDPSQLFFFTQPSLPFLTLDGKIFYESEGIPLLAPDGNGSSLKSLYDSGLLSLLQNMGVELLLFNLIDNPLLDPFDPYLIGAHYRTSSEITIKCIERDQLEEKVGLIIQENGITKVLEYSEFPKEEWEAKRDSSHFKFSLANISLFCFSLSFIEKVKEIELPIHKALKPAPYKDLFQNTIVPIEPNAFKCERFIFDVLPLAKRVSVVKYLREECFSPLKSHVGSGSPTEVQKSLTQRDKEIISKITGTIPPSSCIEIDPSFYYPTEALLNSWKGKKIPDKPYICALS